MSTRAVTKAPRVVFVRVGFHDQVGIEYERNGKILFENILTKVSLAKLSTIVSRETALIVDDNIGNGTTVKFLRRMVESLGGRPIVRCVETAWQIFARDEKHALSDVIEYPSIRYNFHYKLQNRLIHVLSNNRYETYRNEVFHFTRNQKESYSQSLTLARTRGSWSERQLNWLQEEASYLAALANEDEPQDKSILQKLLGISGNRNNP